MTPPAEDELYQAALVARAKQGRARGRLPSPQRSVTLDNPLCGDRITLDVNLANGRVSAIGHQVRGCLLCEASAEIIAVQAPGKTSADLAEAGAALSAVLKNGSAAPAGEWSSLAVFAPVHRVKSRQECVLLPFEALHKALAAG
jgi:NifU-like protein involved in Fe-S cluster formation